MRLVPLPMEFVPIAAAAESGLALSRTLRPVIIAPATPLLPFPVRWPPVRMMPSQSLFPFMVKLPVTMSVPRPSPGSEKFPSTRMTGQ